MANTPELTIRQLRAHDLAAMRSLMRMFGEAFGDLATYTAKPAGDRWLRDLLSSDGFIALAASKHGEIAGGLAAYVLTKFEQERREIYVYDLAVSEAHRRQGVATALLLELKRIAAERGAYVIFIQADAGDEPAISLYAGLGKREDVLHFDIAVDGGSGAAPDHRSR